MAIPREMERYSYSDYLSWPEEERWELIEGVAYSMSPAPNRSHQSIAGEFFRQIANHVLEGPCAVYSAPTDVKLSDELHDETPTVVQPDVAVCCDPSRLTAQGIAGAPDLVIEVVSPESAAMDRKRKFELYERYRVAEYWIVDPLGKLVEVYTVYTLDEQGSYRRRGALAAGEELSPTCLPDLRIDLSLVFRE